MKLHLLVNSIIALICMGLFIASGFSIEVCTILLYNVYIGVMITDLYNVIDKREN